MKTIFLVLLFLALQSHGLECISKNAKADNVADFMTAIAESLNTIKMPFVKMKNTMSKQSSDVVDALVALKELKEGYFCSSKMMEAYKVSKNEYISESAGAISQAYQILGVGVEESISELKKDIDGKNNISPGARAERSADKMLSVRKTWELVIMGIGLGTHASIGKENTKTKKMDSLVITKSERNNVVEILKSNFKELGNKKDNDPIDAAANVYHSFLTQPWKFKSK